MNRPAALGVMKATPAEPGVILEEDGMLFVLPRDSEKIEPSKLVER